MTRRPESDAGRPDLPPELAFERPTDAERYRRAVPGYMKRLRDVYEALHDRFGEAGLELIRDVSREYGERVARNARKKGDRKGVAAVGQYLLRVFDMVGGDWEVAEFSPDRLVIRVRQCPYPFRRDEICLAHTSMEQALVSTLDPDLRYRVACSIPRGDSYCDHVLETVSTSEARCRPTPGSDRGGSPRPDRTDA